jgi:hypothetical protein
MPDDATQPTPAEPHTPSASRTADARLSRLEDYEVAEGYPDIRGWAVRGSNGLEIGVVGELLVDTELLEVSAVDVHLGVGAAAVRGNVMGSARVPIEAVQIRPDRYVVVDIEVIPCDDVLERPVGAEGIVARVPCGQIGIRKRAEGDAVPPASAARGDVEVPRRAVDDMRRE